MLTIAFVRKAKNNNCGNVISKRFVSSRLSPPTQEEIGHVILEQASASEAIQRFRWASQLPNFTHNQSTYRALVHKLCAFRRFDAIPRILREIPTTLGSPPDEDIFVTLVRGLARAHMIPQLIKVLDLVLSFGVHPSLKIYNSILHVLVNLDIDIARAFFRNKMMACGVQADHYTFATLINGLCLTNRIGDAFKLLKLINTRGDLAPNTVLYNTLLHALCKHGKLGRARSLMAHMIQPDHVTYNLMISAYCKQNHLVQALVLFEKSLTLGHAPHVVTTTKLIQLLCNAGRPDEAAHILERVQTNGGILDVLVYNTLIKGFCSLGKPKVGLHFKREMEIKGYLPNVHTYNVLIAGFCQDNLFDLALDLFNEMKMATITYNFVTFDTLIRGLCSNGCMLGGFKVFKLMEESKDGSRGRISPYNSIIYGLYRENRWNEALDFITKMENLFPRAVDRTMRILGLCEEGNVESAKEVYHQMLHEGGTPNALVYSSLIQGFCECKHVRQAFELMNDMVGHGYFPVTSTYNVVIHGFCCQGKIVSALKLMEEMDKRGCLLDEGTYKPLILAYCCKGDLQNALKILRQMVGKGIRPDYWTWNTLLHQLEDTNNMSPVKDRIQQILKA